MLVNSAINVLLFYSFQNLIFSAPPVSSWKTTKNENDHTKVTCAWLMDIRETEQSKRIKRRRRRRREELSTADTRDWSVAEETRIPQCQWNTSDSQRIFYAIKYSRELHKLQRISAERTNTYKYVWEVGDCEEVEEEIKV